VHDGKTLGKVSQLCRVKTKTLDKVSKLCRVSRPKHSAKFVSSPKHSAKFLNFVEFQDYNTRQTLETLPSVTLKTLGKQARNDQILWSLCRVSIRIHSAKPKHSAKRVPRITENGLFVECFALTLGNSSLCRVLHSAKRPRPPFFTNLSRITDPSQFTINHHNSQ